MGPYVFPVRVAMSPEIVINGHWHIPADAFNLDGFRRWVHSNEFPEKARVTYMAGRIDVDMSPEEFTTHATLKGGVFSGLWQWNEAHQLGELLPDNCLLVNEKAKLSTEPDVMFCSWECTSSNRARFVAQAQNSDRLVEVNGAPDLVVEVVSQSSVKKDTVLLRNRYFSAGILEYWLIDGRGKSVDFKLLVRGAKGFRPVPADADGYRRSGVMQGSFLIERTRNRAGRYTYRLLAREP